MTSTEDYAHTVRLLATALDEIGGAIYQQINPDSSYIPVDEHTAELLHRFVVDAEPHLAVMDDPTVKRVVSEATRETR